MAWLFFEILVWLLLAFLVGGITAWLFARMGARRREAELEQSATTAQQRLIAEREGERKARLELAEQVPVLERSINERGELISRLEREVVELAELRAQLPEHQVEAEHQRAMLTAAQSKLESEQTKYAKTRAALADLESQWTALEAKLGTQLEHLEQQHAEEISKREALIATQTKQLSAVSLHLPKLEARLAEFEARKTHDEKQADDSDIVAELEQALQVAREELIDWRRRCEGLQRDMATSAAASAQSNGLPTAPHWLDDSPPAERDDLKIVRGIGPVLERRLNELGIYRYAQLAGMSNSDELWVAMHLKTLPDRIRRDAWAEQARELVAAGSASERYSAGMVIR